MQQRCTMKPLGMECSDPQEPQLIPDCFCIPSSQLFNPNLVSVVASVSDANKLV
jgi:hypothetical protein